MDLNQVSMGYSPADDTIWLLGEGVEEGRVINPMFYETIEQWMNKRPERTFNVRGKNYILRVTPCK